jgi:alpha-1,2-mannosyltransferase
MDFGGLADRIPDEAPVAGGQPPDYSADLPEDAETAAVARDPQIPRWMIVLAVGAFAASVAVLAALDVASPGQRWFMLDLQIYRWGGHVVRHSGDLYGSHFPHYHLRFTYPPMAALIFAVLSPLSMPALKWLVTVGGIISLAVTLWLVWGALGYRRSAERVGAALAVAGVALWLQPVQQTLAFGQVNLILMLIIVADLCLPDTAWRKGMGIGLAAGFKLTPLIFIPYLLLTGRFRAAGVSLATFAVTVAGSLILLPAQSRQFWLGGLLLNSHRTGNNAYVGNQSLHGTLARLLGGVTAAQPYWLASAVIVGVVGLLFAAWAARRGHEMIGVLTCALTGLLISPVSWSHHWVWIAPALAVVADQAFRNWAPASPPPRSGQDTGGLSGWQWWHGWRRWAGWAGVVALAAPFLVVPQRLVPVSIVQGTGADGAQLLTGNLYVTVGLILLCLAGFALMVHERVPSSSLLDGLGRSRGVKIKPLRGRFGNLDTPAPAEGMAAIEEHGGGAGHSDRKC